MKSGLDYDEAKAKLKGLYKTVDGKEHKLKRLVRLNEEIVGDTAEDGTISNKKYIRRDFHWVPFTLVSNPGLILFNNMKQQTCAGKAILSEYLFSNEKEIQALEYDVQKIEAAVLSGMFDGMWTFSFTDRQGNIKRGMVYGDDVNQDTIYGQVRGAPRKFIGINMTSSDCSLKVKVGRTGSVAMFMDWDEPQDVSKIYEIVEVLKPYVVQKA